MASNHRATIHSVMLFILLASVTALRQGGGGEGRGRGGGGTETTCCLGPGSLGRSATGLACALPIVLTEGQRANWTESSCLSRLMARFQFFRPHHSRTNAAKPMGQVPSDSENPSAVQDIFLNAIFRRFKICIF